MLTKAFVLEILTLMDMDKDISSIRASRWSCLNHLPKLWVSMEKELVLCTSCARTRLLLIKLAAKLKSLSEETILVLPFTEEELLLRFLMILRTENNGSRN